MFNLILAEASLELVPRKLRKHPSVKGHAKRFNKTTGEILLDRSYHHTAMSRNSNMNRRGRPDIAHFNLLLAQDSKLNRAGLLRTHIHLMNGGWIKVSPSTRIPKAQDRFNGIIAQLLSLGQQPGKADFFTLVKDLTLGDIINEFDDELVIMCEEKGSSNSLFEVLSEKQIPRSNIGNNDENRNVTIIVGAFPRGEFISELNNDEFIHLSISKEPLESWTVISNIINEIERYTGI